MGSRLFVFQTGGRDWETPADLMASTFVGDLEPPDLHRAALRFRTAACTFSARARCDCLTRSLSLWQQRAALRNSLAEAKRSRVWQFGLGSGIDSFEFH